MFNFIVLFRGKLGERYKHVRGGGSLIHEKELIHLPGVKGVVVVRFNQSCHFSVSLTDSDTAMVPRISRELQATRWFCKKINFVLKG